LSQSKSKFRWVRRFIFTALFITLGYMLMGFLYKLPDISSRTESLVISDGADTTLGREFSKELAANPDKTGVYLLGNGRDAFAARALLARKAEKSLDIQYYMYHQDTVGSLLTDEVLKAADRGVRVRMLIDDIYGNENEDTWVALDAHPQIEVRMWNPWERGKNRMIQSVFRALDINYRMHSKSFTADNQATILGGRNIGDEYFDADKSLAFADMDVLTIGSPVAAVSFEFDEYWNSAHAYPVNILIRQGTEADVDQLREREPAFYKKNTTIDYVKALKDSDFALGLNNGSLAFNWADGAKVIHDSPDKEQLGKKGGKDELLISQLAPYIINAKKTVDIVSPYFVPGDKAVDALCKLSRDGVKVRILTNSLASNDVSAVHAGYSKYRRPLLRCGVELYELDETLKNREGKTFTWLPGLEKSSLHAKSMVFDGEIMFVGSFNFDQRSLFINTEIGLVFHDPEIAGASARNFEENVNNVAFKVDFERAGGNENLHWTGGQGGPDVDLEKEPYATTMQKFIVGILKWLPIDSQL
jgi:putative cardiolipin synthase